MLLSGVKCYHMELMLSSGTKCYHLGSSFIMWDAMLSSGANVIIWDEIISSVANVIMLKFGANVIIWCYHVMLSSGMMTFPFYFSWKLHSLAFLGQFYELISTISDSEGDFAFLISHNNFYGKCFLALWALFANFCKYISISVWIPLIKIWMPLSHISISGSWEPCVRGPAAPFLAGIKNTKKKKR